MKRIPLLTFILSLCLVCTQLACTQAKDRSDDDDNNEEAKEQKDDKYKLARATFEQKYPDAKDVDWNTDSNDYYEAEFEQDDEKYRADFEQDGTWIETENSIDYDDLPEAIQEAVKRDYDPDDITEVEQVDHAKKGKFYDVEFKDKGKNKDVEYREDGSVING
ncbi:MAG: PepSY-like domain-containing protein [Cyclobacteriaceae bacterium]